MHISILGAGRVGANLAYSLANKGYQVTLGHRDPERAASQWQGPEVTHRSIRDAAAASPLVINATPGESAVETFMPLSDVLAGRILLDVSNATVREADLMPGGLRYPGSSVAEHLQMALPQTHVVKGLNTMLFSVMTAPQNLATPANVFLSGNDAEAKAQVKELLAALGWPADWIVDLGGIESARATEAMILLVPHLFQVWGMRPFALSVAR